MSQPGQDFALRPHPDTPPGVVSRLSVRSSRHDGLLRLRYALRPVSSVLLPEPATPARRDGLWRTTCFELFVRRGDEAGYHEYNFAPSGEWAAYGFSGYREGMVPLDVAPPVIARTRTGVAVSLALAGPVTIGISAVIEELDGTKSYWAIAHPPGRPDFHHPACFAAELAAPPAA